MSHYKKKCRDKIHFKCIWHWFESLFQEMCPWGQFLHMLRLIKIGKTTLNDLKLDCWDKDVSVKLKQDLRRIPVCLLIFIFLYLYLVLFFYQFIGWNLWLKYSDSGHCFIRKVIKQLSFSNFTLWIKKSLKCKRE